MKIWLLVGEEGEYSDFHTWVEAAFQNYETAQLALELLIDTHNAEIERRDADDDDYVSSYERDRKYFLNEIHTITGNPEILNLTKLLLSQGELDWSLME